MTLIIKMMVMSQMVKIVRQASSSQLRALMFTSKYRRRAKQRWPLEVLSGPVSHRDNFLRSSRKWRLYDRATASER